MSPDIPVSVRTQTDTGVGHSRLRNHLSESNTNLSRNIFALKQYKTRPLTYACDTHTFDNSCCGMIPRLDQNIAYRYAEVAVDKELHNENTNSL